MDPSRWLKQRTFHHASFPPTELALLKESASLRIGVAIPTLNEEATIGGIVSHIRRDLIEDTPLVDRLLVVDSGSDDRTLARAAAAGAETATASEILPHLPPARGKGENLWKACHLLADCDILAFVDGDVANFHFGFVTGLLGPLLQHPEIRFCKAFYHRPLAAGDFPHTDPGGGRVTEILIRPLLALLRPELQAVIQPLSGEYAIHRELLASLPIPTGYGVEIANLIDIHQRHGFAAMAQVDLDERIHRTRPTRELGHMAFAILHALWPRLAPNDPLPDHLTRHFCPPEARGDLTWAQPCQVLADFERPPLHEIVRQASVVPNAKIPGEIGELTPN